jgi:hypothetical protein
MPVDISVDPLVGAGADAVISDRSGLATGVS